MSCPPNWPPKQIPEGSVRARDIALGDHITFYRAVWDSSKNRFRDDLWEKIDATVGEISGDRIILWSVPGYCKFKPKLWQIADGKPIRELWANEEEREPFATLRLWEPSDHIPYAIREAIEHNDAYEARRDRLEAEANRKKLEGEGKL